MELLPEAQRLLLPRIMWAGWLLLPVGQWPGIQKLNLCLGTAKCIVKCAWKIWAFTGTFMIFLYLNATEQIVKYSSKLFFQNKQRDYCQDVPDISYFD